jgi:hypothetical protein
MNYFKFSIERKHLVLLGLSFSLRLGRFTSVICSDKVEYREGQLIQLSPHDLAEICLFIKTTSRAFVQEVQAYVKGQGIPEVGQEADG